MWLLNADTLKLEYFEGSRIPPYVILSHRWGDDEVTYDDIKNGIGRHKQGWSKVMLCCQTALSRRQRAMGKRSNTYVWIDTCCIDKSNSSELSEAINSMYNWYSNAQICYTYLSDVSRGDYETSFEHSVWFTRGWTLQELLAPIAVTFFDHTWIPLGTRDTLGTLISQTTDIPLGALKDFRLNPSRYAVAERMSWAAGRKCTREEDIAYSMLGIFEVNMPLIYGEGQRAFVRLQEEILKNTDDLSIFALGYMTHPKASIWSSLNTSYNKPKTLLKSPILYAKSGFMLSPYYPAREIQNADLTLLEGSSVSARGIMITLKLIAFCQDCYLVPVAKSWGSYPNFELKCMLIRRVGSDGRFYRGLIEGRLLIGLPESLSFASKSRRIILMSDALWGESAQPSSQCEMSAMTLKGLYGISLEGLLGLRSDRDKVGIFSNTDPGSATNCMMMHVCNVGFVGMIHIGPTEKGSDILLHFGFDFDFNAVCLVIQLTDTFEPNEPVCIASPVHKHKQYSVTCPQHMKLLLDDLEAIRISSLRTPAYSVHEFKKPWNVQWQDFDITDYLRLVFVNRRNPALGLSVSLIEPDRSGGDVVFKQLYGNERRYGFRLSHETTLPLFS